MCVFLEMCGEIAPSTNVSQISFHGADIRRPRFCLPKLWRICFAFSAKTIAHNRFFIRLTFDASSIFRATENYSRLIINRIIRILMKISVIASFLDFSRPRRYSLFASRKRFSISHRAAYKAATSLPARSCSEILVK